MSIKLTHIALHVKDLEASKAFYESWADMVDVSPLDSQKSPWLSSPGDEGQFALVLVPGAKAVPEVPDPLNTTRLGFSVGSKDKLKALFNRAVAAGNVVQAYEETADGKRARFRVTDPNGYLIEFWSSESSAGQDNARLRNMTLHATDMDDAVEFYQEWADMDILLYGKISKSCRLVSKNKPDAFQLIICDDAAKPSDQNPSNISHIGFAVSSMDELRDIYDRAVSADIVDIHLRTMKAPAGTLFFVRDPDRYRVEFSFGQPLGDGYNAQPPMPN